MFKTQEEFYLAVDDDIDCLDNNELCEYLSNFLWQTGRDFFSIFGSEFSECEFYDFLRDCMVREVLEEYNLTQEDIDKLPEGEEA